MTGNNATYGKNKMTEQKIIYLTPVEARRLEAFKKRYREEARKKFEERVAFFHPLTGGNYTSITVRDQRSRWGSCSSRGTLSFNYRLIFSPPEVLDYVVVHELCHLTHMNHSKDFWNKVASVMPEYKIQKQWLRDHGQELGPEAHMEKLGIPLKLD